MRGQLLSRLIELLPRRLSPRMPLAEQASGVRAMTGPTVATILICAALAVIALIMAASCEPSSRGDQADAPAVTDYPPQQTLPRYR